MAHKETFTDKSLKALKPAEPGKRYEMWDTVVPNFGVRVTANGTKTFFVLKRTTHVSQLLRHTIGQYPRIKLIDARAEARRVVEGVLSGEIVPKSEVKRRNETKQFDAIATSFIAEHLDRNTRNDEGARIVRKYLIPYFKGTPIDQIKRSHITAMVREIGAGKFTDETGRTVGGPVMADRVLGRLSKLMNWYAVSDDDFVSPITPGMRLTKEKDRKRTRVLTDEELRAFWITAQRKPRWNNGPNVFGGIVRACLLTAQRRDAVAGMKRSEIIDGVWNVPPDRDKGGKPRMIPLSKGVQQIIDDSPQIDECDHVFTTNGKAAFSGFSRSKGYFDKAMIEILIARATKRVDNPAIRNLTEIQSLMVLADKGDQDAKDELNTRWWRLHDLRRTAKTLMVRAGVRPDISERALSHEIAGVEGIYDQWNYLPETRDAFDQLDAIVMQIVGDGAQ